MKKDRLSRRNFLQIAALSMGAIRSGSAFAADTGVTGISLILDPADPVGSTAPVTWAIQELAGAISATGIAVRRFSSIDEAPRSDVSVVAAASATPLASALLKKAGLPPP